MMKAPMNGSAHGWYNKAGRFCYYIAEDKEDPVLFRRDAYLLTASGKELYQIIHNSEGFKADRDYALLCLRDMKNENPVFYVGAFEQSVKGQHRDLLEEV